MKSKNNKSFIYNADEIKNSYFYMWLTFLYDNFWKLYFNIKLKNPENIPKHNKSVIYISRHSTHNYEVVPGSILLSKYHNKPIRGIGHYYVNILIPYAKYCGIVVGTKDNVNHLIDNNEIIFIFPGGQEELTIGSDNAYVVNWKSKSGNYRTGFAKIA